MKTSIKALALAAILSFTACSDDDYSTPVENDLIGSWEETFTDKNIQSDGTLTYMLNANKTCLIESCNFLANPEEQVHVVHGYWSLSQSGNKPTLSITYYYEDKETGEERSQTSRLTISNFSGNKFHATSENSSQEKIFTRLKSFAYTK